MNKKFVQYREIPIPIIFEDEDILVIDKPAGVSAHEAPGEADVTVNEYFSDKYTGPNQTGRDMIVHRLDKGTSGVMILAKNPSARDNLQKQFAEREVQKAYITLVYGHVTERSGIIDMPLGRDIRKREKISPQKEGKPAVTEFEVIYYYDGFTLLEAKPKTGRTHQIRVHLAAIGHPIAGDTRYGREDNRFNRIFLHAAKIVFRHPTTAKEMTYEVELPKELENVLARLNSTK